MSSSELRKKLDFILSYLFWTRIMEGWRPSWSMKKHEAYKKPHRKQDKCNGLWISEYVYYIHSQLLLYVQGLWPHYTYICMYWEHLRATNKCTLTPIISPQTLTRHFLSEFSVKFSFSKYISCWSPSSLHVYCILAICLVYARYMSIVYSLYV